MNGLTLRISPKYFAPQGNKKVKEVSMIHVPPEHLAPSDHLDELECVTWTNMLQKLSSSITVEEQMGAVKEISLNLHLTMSEPQIRNISEKYLHLVIDLYLRAPLKHPIKSALRKSLNFLPASAHPMAIDILRNYLHHLMNSALDSQDFIDLHTAISALHGCYDNLNLGPNLMQNELSYILTFLNSTLSMCSKSIDILGSPILKMETCKLLHSGTQIIVSALQQGANSQECDEINSLLSDLLSTTSHLMNHPEVPLDTRSICGFAVVLILDCLHGNKLWFELLKLDNKHKDVLEQEMHDDISYLCICSGLLSALKWDQLLLCEENNKQTLLSCVLNLVLLINERGSQESSVILGLWRVVQQISRILTSHSEMVLHLDASSLISLLQLVWGQLDHYMDTIRHLARVILSNLLQLRDALGAIGVDVAANMTEAVLKFPPTKRSRYIALSVMASHLGAEEVLRKIPDVISMLMEAMQCSSSNSYATSAMISLLTSHYSERAQSDWIDIWVTPLLLALQNHSGIEVNTFEEVLSKAVKLCPGIISHVLPQTQSLEGAHPSQMKAILTCMKIGRKQGVLISKDLGESKFWRGVVPLDFLYNAMSHQNDEIRLATLALVVECNRSTEVLTDTDLCLVKHFLQYSISHDVPAVRQQGLALIVKLLVRLKDSAHCLHRAAEQKKDDDNNVTAPTTSLAVYNKFIHWLVNFCFTNLLPGSNFSRRACSLHILTLIQDIVAMKALLSTSEWNALLWTSENAQILFNDIIIDTFDDNKTLATKLLVSFPPEALGLDKEECVSTLFKRSCMMASSIHPAECLSAAYLMQLCVSLPLSLQVLTKHYTSKKVQGVAAEVAIFHAIECLRRQLEEELKVAEHSILQAASNGPMYGSLFCIRHLLQLIPDLAKVEDKSFWGDLMNYLVDLSFKLNAAVASVVNSSSPEGHLPMDFDPGSVHLKNETEEKVVSIPPVKVTAQMVLLCSWRTVKEVSLFLGELSDKCPILPDQNGLLTEEKLLSIGSHFTTLMEGTKHRGAFEQAYVGFSLLAARLWRYTQSSLHKLPTQWLNELMEAIQSTKQASSKLCATRRSAGVPFMVQALVSAELQAGGGSQCLQQSLSQLLSMAEDSNKHVECRTHALNILRALFRHAQLGELVTPFVARGIIVAISGFRGQTWAERNSATLLFSSLMTRVFGVRRSRGELGWRNKMTGRIFFHRYPELYSFLLNELQRATAALHTCNTAELATLYPVLLLLARLYPSSLEGTDSTMQLSAFVPWVHRSAGSSVLKTRIVAAQAIVPLITANVFVTYIDELIQQIGQPCPENLTHGMLLQVLYLLRNSSVLDMDQRKALQNHIGKWLLSLSTLLVGQNSFVVMQTFLQVTELIAHNWLSSVPSSLWFELLENISKTLWAEKISTKMLNFAMGKSLYEAQATRVVLLLCTLQGKEIEEKILNLLNHQSYEVVQETLVFMEHVLGDEICDMDEEEEEILYDINEEIGHWTKRLPPSELSQMTTYLCKSRNVGKRLAALALSSQGLRSRLALRVLSHLDPITWHEDLTLRDLLPLCYLDQEAISCAALACITSILSYILDFQALLPAGCQNLGKLLLLCSSEDRSVASRTTAVKFLLVHRPALQRKYSFLSDEAVCELWTCVLKLCLDDDLSVRQKACKLVNAASPPVSGRALEHLVEEFVQVMTPSVSYCKAALIAWTLGSLPDYRQADFAEERVFDKGEMNLFSEQEVLSEIAYRSLDKMHPSSVELPENVLHWVLCLVCGNGSYSEVTSLQSLLNVVRCLLSDGVRKSENTSIIPSSLASANHRLLRFESVVCGSNYEKLTDHLSFKMTFLDGLCL